MSLVVNNVLGKEVARLAEDIQSEGEHIVHFDAGSLPSGIYIYELRANDYVTSKKMMLLK